MQVQIHSFVHMLFISMIALFPVINPFGSALIVNPYLSQLTDVEEKAAVKKITLYAFSICVVTLFAGHWILELFGLTIPVIQIAGGIMICKMGWEALSANVNKQNAEKNVGQVSESNSESDINDMLFYPLTFPVTTGAGTMAVLFTLSAHSADAHWEKYLVNTAAILLAIIIMCLLVYAFYGNTKKISKRLGTNGQTIANRIIAFLIFCVGLQIAITGIKSLV
ncbi:MAG: multiple antibiotic resistance (MarC)-like protein [Sphingobacteriales bacterium UTBCD1]|nr:MAG: multiple antibiotic resistance (MarC)-like protein [Sphingobacteriales bacterium UTBCD1]